MIRTQIYLPKEIYHEVDLLAKRENKPKAQVIREAVTKAIKQKKRQKNAGDALLEIAKWAKKNNIRSSINLSTEHDKYYEEI